MIEDKCKAVRNPEQRESNKICLEHPPFPDGVRIRIEQHHTMKEKGNTEQNPSQMIPIPGSPGVKSKKKHCSDRGNDEEKSDIEIAEERREGHLRAQPHIPFPEMHPEGVNIGVLDDRRFPSEEWFCRPSQHVEGETYWISVPLGPPRIQRLCHAPLHGTWKILSFGQIVPMMVERPDKHERTEAEQKSTQSRLGYSLSRLTDRNDDKGYGHIEEPRKFRQEAASDTEEEKNGIGCFSPVRLPLLHLLSQ